MRISMLLALGPRLGSSLCRATIPPKAGRERIKRRLRVHSCLMPTGWKKNGNMDTRHEKAIDSEKTTRIIRQDLGHHCISTETTRRDCLQYTKRKFIRLLPCTGAQRAREKRTASQPLAHREHAEHAPRPWSCLGTAVAPEGVAYRGGGGERRGGVRGRNLKGWTLSAPRQTTSSRHGRAAC